MLILAQPSAAEPEISYIMILLRLYFQNLIIWKKKINANENHENLISTLNILGSST